MWRVECAIEQRQKERSEINTRMRKVEKEDTADERRISCRYSRFSSRDAAFFVPFLILKKISFLTRQVWNDGNSLKQARSRLFIRAASQELCRIVSEPLCFVNASDYCDQSDESNG